MADNADAAGVPEEPPKDAAALARLWCAEISAAEKAHKKWVERSKKIEKIYCDDRDRAAGGQRKFNVLWSNVETQMPAVYMQTPKAKAVRRYNDRDPTARFASMVLERCLQTSCELYDFDNTMTQAVRDRLVPGRGVAWVFYEPQIEGEALAYESVVADYVPWQDYLQGYGRTESEVPWKARRFRLDRDGLKKFILDRGFTVNPRNIAMDFKSDGSAGEGGGESDRKAQAQIWEIWDKTSGQVIYLAPGSAEHALVGVRPPPVRFMGFFPCPRPLLATITSQSLIPTPDYVLYQDQAEELNKLTDRIITLEKAVKVAGVYSSKSKELADLLESSDNRMVAVENWAMFAEAGGVKGGIEWYPIEQVVNVLKVLYEAREQAKQTLYEISGIGDILRGATDPTETATAQGIKAKWGSLRVRRIQKDVQRFAADLMRLKAEVMAEAFQFRTLLQMAGVDREMLLRYAPAPELPPMPEGAPPEKAQQMQQQAQMQAVETLLKETEALLRDDVARNFRIDVETDSTLEPDQQEEKQAAVEFVTAIGAFLEKGAPMAAQGPEAAKMVGEMLLFAVRRFDKVDQLEQVIEQAVEAAAKPKPPQPNPDMMKAEVDAKRVENDDKHKTRELDIREMEVTAKQEVERARVVVEAKGRRRELDHRERELANADREFSHKSTLEREQLEDGKAARKDQMGHERRMKMSDEQAEDDMAAENGEPTKVEILTAAMKETEERILQIMADMSANHERASQKIIEQMQRPRRLARDPVTGEKIAVST